MRQPDGSYYGDLYRTRGPVFNANPFNPSQVTATPVGAMRLSFANGESGTLVYSVNGATVTKSITRHPRPGHPEPNLVRIRTPEGEVEIANDFVFAMTGYRPDFEFMERHGISVTTVDLSEFVTQASKLSGDDPAVRAATMLSPCVRHR